MEILANLALNNNEVADLVFAEETTYPSNPTLGMPVFIGGRLMVATSRATDGSAIWTPLSNDIEGMEFTQAAPLTVWEIPHQFDDNSIIAQVTGTDGLGITPIATNLGVAGKVILTFAGPVQGKAFLLHRILSQAATEITGGNTGGGGGGNTGEVVSWASFTGASNGPVNFDVESNYIDGIWNGGTGGDTSESNIVKLTPTRFAYANENDYRDDESNDEKYIRLNSAKTLGSATGLANDATVFNATVILDGWNITKNVSVVGSDAQTYQQLVDALNPQLSPDAVVSISAEGWLAIKSLNPNVQNASVDFYGTDVSDPSQNLWASLTDFRDTYQKSSGSTLVVYDLNTVSNEITRTSTAGLPTGDAEDDDMVAMDANTIFWSGQAEGDGHRYGITKIANDGTITHGQWFENELQRDNNVSIAKVGTNRAVGFIDSADWSTSPATKTATLMLFGTDNDVVSELGRLEVLNSINLYPNLGQDPDKQGENYSTRYGRIVPLNDGKVLGIYWYQYSYYNADWSVYTKEPKVFAFVASTAGDTLTLLGDGLTIDCNPDDPSQFIATDGTGGLFFYSDNDTDIGTAIAFKVDSNNVITASAPVAMTDDQVYYELAITQASAGQFVAVMKVETPYDENYPNEWGGTGDNPPVTLITTMSIDSNGTPVRGASVTLDGEKPTWPLVVGLDSHRVAYVTDQSIDDPENPGQRLSGTTARILYQP